MRPQISSWILCHYISSISCRVRSYLPVPPCNIVIGNNTVITIKLTIVEKKFFGSIMSGPDRFVVVSFFCQPVDSHTAGLVHPCQSEVARIHCQIIRAYEYKSQFSVLFIRFRFTYIPLQEPVLHCRIVTFFPRQSRPLQAGGGLLHDLSLVWFPVPQPSKQDDDLDQSDHFDHTPCTGPGNCYVCSLFIFALSVLQFISVLHSRVSKCSPSQSFPPLIGDGLVQSRVRDMAPRPQV